MPGRSDGERNSQAGRAAAVARRILAASVADAVDSELYPRLAEYVRRLPQGLASYPECKAKGTLVTSALEEHDTSALGPGLPEAVVQVLRSPPLAGVWVHGTLSDAVFYTIADAFYGSDEAVMAWTRDRTRRTADSKVYRAIARVARPALLLRMAAAAHALFQRGTDLIVEPTDDGATVRLTHPPYLHGGLNHLSNVAMFEVLLELAGAQEIRVDLTISAATHAVYGATWRE